MLKSVEDISATKKRLTIEIPADTLEDEIRDSLEKVKRTATIPGFRAGKAPINLIEKKFGKKVEGEVLDRLIPKAYLEALKEADIAPVTDPVLEDHFDFKRHQPISMKFTVEIMPKIADLTYEGVAVKELPVSVDDADIDGVLKRSQEEKATYEPSEGPADVNDLVSFDCATADGEIDLKDQIFKIGSSMFPEEFSRELTGRKKGERVSIESDFPAEHRLEKLAGKHLALNVVINDIKKVNLPELNDEFAKDTGFDNLAALKDHVREEILKAKRNELAKIQKAEIMRKLLDAYEFDVPESMFESELEGMKAAAQRRRGEQEQDEAGDAETVTDEMRQAALRNVRGALLLSAIGRKEGIAVSEEEMKRVILSMAQRFGVPPESLIKFYASRDGSLDGLRNSIFEDKVLDLILSKAVVEKGE
jgi:trigger factor